MEPTFLLCHSNTDSEGVYAMKSLALSVLENGAYSLAFVLQICSMLTEVVHQPDQLAIRFSA